MSAADLPPTVRFPEKLDRTLRLGPFPSGRDALRFVTYAAVGACLAPFVPPALWLGVVLLGFVSSVWKPGGEAIEARFVRFVAWEVRRTRRVRTMTGATGTGRTHRAHLTLGSGVRAAVVRAAGLPLAYLPSAELGRRFEIFRELVQGLEGGFLVYSTLVPIHPTPLLPTEPVPGGAEREARRGYQELVELIARGRSVRRVFVAVGCTDPGLEGIGRLEATVATLVERLRALGLNPIRLRDRALGEAARRIGLGEGSGAQ